MLPLVMKQSEKLRQRSSSELREEVIRLRAKVATCRRQPGRRWFRSQPSSDCLPEATAVIFEAVRRILDKTLYPVQLFAGMSLGNGKIVCMATGEGKTITTAIPAFVQALSGRGVHVATTNAYLAERDCNELSPVFEALGMKVGLLTEKADAKAKAAAYEADITFGTGYDFGFDFLRDQIQLRAAANRGLGHRHLMQLYGAKNVAGQLLQREPFSTVIDEADSVLIDEATMPLILSGQAGKKPPRRLYELAQNTADALEFGSDYEVDSTRHTLTLHEAGWKKIHRVLATSEVLPLARPWTIYIENALRARWLIKRDVNYVILDGKVALVDQWTGRIQPDRTWREGLHQAIELREDVALTAESESDARVTRQRFFGRYSRVCGLTGTTVGIENELDSLYGLETIPIPTHRRCIREEWPMRAFRDEASRDRAIADEVVRLHRLNRPQLVGTRTIQQSRQIAELLGQRGLVVSLLNGVQDADEAAVVAVAGRAGSILIATNMAGRGTDIRLDSAAMSAGGLHVLAIEKNFSRRVDRQLIGRAARQGNPGSCQFFVTAEDDLLQRYPTLAKRMVLNAGDNGECENDFADDVTAAQVDLETEQQEQRGQMAAQDQWLDTVLETLASAEAR